MALTKETVVDKIEVLESNAIQVRKVTRILEDGEVLSSSYHRHVLSPGDDLTNEDPKVVAIGETGLDYFRREGDGKTDDLEWQRERFRVHIRAAKAARKPLIIHTREAAHDTLQILREEGAFEVGGVMHCFTESVAVAKAAIEMNFLISLSGIVTFKNATQVHDVAREIALDHLMIETDSPFLAPAPHRGKTNEPSFVVYVAHKIAELKGCPVERVAKATSQNFERFISGEMASHA